MLRVAGIPWFWLVAIENHSHPMAGDASSENGKLSTGYPQAIHLLYGSNIPYSIATGSGSSYNPFHDENNANNANNATRLPTLCGTCYSVGWCLTVSGVPFSGFQGYTHPPFG